MEFQGRKTGGNDKEAMHEKMIAENFPELKRNLYTLKMEEF